MLGEVLAILPPSAGLLAAGALVVVVLFVLFCAFGEYTRKAHVSGYLAPDKGFIKVFTRDFGTVAERRVEENQVVKKGDVLFVLSLDRNGLDGLSSGRVAVEETRRREQAARREREQAAALRDLQLEQAHAHVEELSEELKKVDRQIELQKLRVASLGKATERFASLKSDHFISENQYQQQLGQQLEQEVALASLDRTRMGLVHDIGGARRQIPELELKSQSNVSSLERQVSSIDQDLADIETRRQIAITAPADGYATAIQVEPGQATNPNYPLLSIVPIESTLEARLLAPATAIGFIQPGKQVNLRYAAYPFQRFGHYRGTVRQVSKTVVTPSEVPIPIRVEDAYYVIRVALDQQSIQAYGENLPLRSGMALDADVLLDRRPIYEWVFEPLFSIRGRL
jgi:membrane fusion protein